MGHFLLVGEASYLEPWVQRVRMFGVPPYPPAVNPLTDLQQAACQSSALIEATDSGIGQSGEGEDYKSRPMGWVWMIAC